MTQKSGRNARPFYREFRRVAAASLVGMLVSGVGCSEGPGATSAERPDACELLTRADFIAVLGSEPAEPQARAMGKGEFWATSCTYQADVPGGLGTASLLLRPHHVAAGPGAAFSEYEAGLVAAFGEDARLTPVEALGERAGWQDFGTSIGQLAVFDGPYQFIFTASATATADQLANARHLAGLVLPRMQAD
jgi:hypothetical protein